MTFLRLVLTALHCCWVFQGLTPKRIPRLIHSQPLGQQLDHPEQLSPALFISQLVKPSPRDQKNLREQLSPTVGEQGQELLMGQTCILKQQNETRPSNHTVPVQTVPWREEK